MEAACAGQVQSAQAEPIRFQGKPVSTCPRSHSSAVQKTASAITRATPRQPHLQVSRYGSQAEYERDARRMLADGWRMSGWQRLEDGAMIATWVRDEHE